MIPLYKITRFFPVKVGITGLRRDLPLKPAETIFPLEKTILNLPDGIRIDTARRNETLLFYYFYNVIRYYRSSPLFRYMERHLGKDDIFVDIGANLGFYSYLAKKICGSRVFLFEPEPGHLEYLRRNRHLFDRIFDIALSDAAGEAEFYVGDDKNLGGSSLVPDARGWEVSNYSHTIMIRAQRLDEVDIDPELISKIRIIKIDVEGAEKFVVEGMQGLLNDNQFDIWCEVRGENSARNPGSYLEVGQLLKKFDYQPFIFDGKRMIPFSQRHVRQVFDILFKRNNSDSGTGTQ